jgi:hypothetical protein
MGEIVKLPTSIWHSSFEEAIKVVADKADGLGLGEKRKLRDIYNYLATRFRRNPTYYAQILQRDMDYIPYQQIVYWLKCSIEDVINIHAWSIYYSEITIKNEVII